GHGKDFSFRLCLCTSDFIPFVALAAHCESNTGQMKQILQTDRLLLRELDSADLAFLFDFLSDPDVMRFWPNPLTKEECNDWLQRQRVRYEERGYGYWLAINKALGEPLGQAGVLQIEVDHRSETALGYIIGKAYWNRGYATEAAAGCL